MKAGNVFNSKFMALVALLAALAMAACVVEPVPPTLPTPTPFTEAPAVEMDPTPAAPLGVTPTPTQPLEGMPTPQTVQLPDGRTYLQYAQPPQMAIDRQRSYTATLNTSRGNITIRLFASEVPVTVNNFVFLAREGFYQGVPFHRVMEGFMVQTGDPRGDGSGGPGYRFQDEPVTRSYTRGKVAMANAGPNTNGSQFFIVHGANAGLPPSYTIFGEVVDGMEVVDAIATAEVRPNPYGELSSPVDPVTIQSVQIAEGN